MSTHVSYSAHDRPAANSGIVGPLAQRRIGAVTIAAATRSAALHLVWAAVAERQRRIFAFCNAHTVSMASKDAEFARALQMATVFNDGFGVDIASRLIHGASFPDNLNGTDFTADLLRGLPGPTRIFLLGAAPGIAEQAAVQIRRRYPLAQVAGVHHGFFAEAENAAVVHAINQADAQIILVGMGHPLQELWASGQMGAVNGVMLCIGAFIDFSAQQVTRAPALVRRLRCEWLFRLMMEPRRLLRRYTVGVAIFFLVVIRQLGSAER